LKARLLASGALILVVLGLLTQFETMVSTPATESVSTFRRTITDDPNDASPPTGASGQETPDIESVTFQGVGDSLKIIMRLSHGSFLPTLYYSNNPSDHFLFRILLSLTENEALPVDDSKYILIYLDWLDVKGKTQLVCGLLDTYNITLSQKTDCSVLGKIWTVTLPKFLFSYQSGFYTRALIFWDQTCVPNLESEYVDLVPNSNAGWSYINGNVESTDQEYYPAITSSYSNHPLIVRWEVPATLLVATELITSFYTSRTSRRRGSSQFLDWEMVS
jgi:hypothetical protein